jgi:hypothetical protein
MQRGVGGGQGGGERERERERIYLLSTFSFHQSPQLREWCPPSPLINVLISTTNIYMDTLEAAQ